MKAKQLEVLIKSVRKGEQQQIYKRALAVFDDKENELSDRTKMDLFLSELELQLGLVSDWKFEKGKVLKVRCKI